MNSSDSCRQRILLLTPRWPYPPFGGDKLFVSHVARALREHSLTLLSLCGTREEMDCAPEPGIFAEVHKVYLPQWRSYWNALAALPGRNPLQLAYYSSGEFQRKADELAPRHDAVLAHLIRTGQYIAMRDYGVPRVLLMADAISMTYRRMSRLPRSFSLWPLLYHTEIRRLEACERRLPRQFDQTWLHSDVDGRFLGLEENRIRIVPMGVDLEDFPFRPSADGDVVAFIGNMSSSMNLDACRHFICDMLPDLRAKAGIRFRVIGSCPPTVKRELEKYPDVEVTGRVDRIVDATGGVFCGVCPLRGGAGIQNKILNYLALGIPCVTSEIGLEGLRAKSGRDLLVYKSVDEAVGMILGLHSDAQLRRNLATNGRQFVEREHDWATVYRRIQEEVSNLWTDAEEKKRGRVLEGTLVRVRECAKR